MPVSNLPRRGSPASYSNFLPYEPSSGNLPVILGTAAGTLASRFLLGSQASSTASEGGIFREGADIDIQSQEEARTGRRRRRRRRLLTCSDKADIAYLVGQLGTGQLGKAAVTSLLSRRCG